MFKWYRLLAIAGFLLALSIGFADDVYITVDVTPSPVPPNTIRATMLAIAQVNPFATLLIFLMPVIIGEGIINAFEGVKVNEPLKAAIRLLILIISLALFAAVF